MGAPIAAYRGCLLGLAVGDAMGYAVDAMSWAEIQENYGPNGLLGYDLVNGYAEISSYTQLAAFTCNGLLLGVTRGQIQGKMAPFVRYISLAGREWAAGQRPWGRPSRTFCWLLNCRELCRRHCMDTCMMDALSRESVSTPEDPVNRFTGPASITAAAGVGLFFRPERMDQLEIDRLGAESVALAHGSPLAFLPGAAVAHIISRLLQDRNIPMANLFRETADALENQFGHEYSQTYEVTSLIRQAISMGADGDLRQVDAMERLRCDNSAQVLAGAIYACLTSGEDFDAAMITAVNHSGHSAAVGALTGAILGMRLGDQALPDFYLECLESADILRELADDLFQGCPMTMGGKLFDGDWDRKYLHGGR